jgi:hypothetical protein
VKTFLANRTFFAHWLPSKATNKSRDQWTTAWVGQIWSATWIFTACGQKPVFIILFYFIFLVGLGFELKALSLQSRCSTAWVTPPVHFALVIFWRWLPLYLGFNLTHCLEFWRWVLENRLFRLAWNLNPPRSQPPKKLGLQAGATSAWLQF